MTVELRDLPDVPGLGYNVGLSYLFESPRVGNMDFVKAFDQEFARRIPMYRITHSRDPVPHLPPRFLTGFKYEHVNYEACRAAAKYDEWWWVLNLLAGAFTQNTYESNPYTVERILTSSFQFPLRNHVHNPCNYRLLLHVMRLLSQQKI